MEDISIDTFTEDIDVQVKETVSRLPEWQTVIIAAAGLALMFFGYRIKKIAFFIAWFIIGFTITNYLMPIIGNTFHDLRDSSFWQTLIPVAGGAVLALLGFSIEKVCVGGIAFGGILIIAMGYFGTEMQSLAISAVLGVVAAGFAVMLMKPATILATSAIGAYALSTAIITLGNLDFGTLYFPILLGLTLFGAVIQFATTKHIV